MAWQASSSRRCRRSRSFEAVIRWSCSSAARSSGISGGRGVPGSSLLIVAPLNRIGGGHEAGMTGHMGFSAGFRRSLGLCIIGPGALAGWYNFFHFSPAGLQNDAGKLGVNRRIGSTPVPEFSPSPPPSHPAPGAGAALPPVRLKVLHLEDNEGDHALVTAHLRRGGIEADITRVETEIALIEALAEDWDLILSDYNLPGYSGLAALA